MTSATTRTSARPLSKGYLLGKEERDSVFVHEPAWYAQARHRTAPRPDRRRHRPRRQDRPPRATAPSSTTTSCCWPPAPSRAASTSPAPTWPASTICAASPTPTGCASVLAALGRDNGHLVIAGAGWIGLEVAAAARGYGAEVTVVEPEPTPLHAVLGPELGQLFAELHREHGVRFHFGARLTEITGQDGMVLAARTDDGEEHPAHDVLAAIGAAPRTALAEAAGLDARRPGARRRHRRRRARCAPPTPTSTRPATWPPSTTRCSDTRLRVEHWANALNGGPAAARAMLGQDVTYDRVPYFFSDQYDLGMEYSGWAPPGSYDQVVLRGDAGKREFIAFWLKDGRVLAGMNVNVWDVTDPIQQLIRSGAPVDPRGPRATRPYRSTSCS